jgi:ornithine--oxo-acid transaminase
MKNHDFIELDQQYAAANYEPLPITIEKGKGCWVWDVEGNKYLDCIASYSALNQGHCHPKIIKAITEQAQKLTLTSRAVHHPLMAPLLKKLCHLSGLEKGIMMNSGAEAVETAIKLARKWAYCYNNIPDEDGEIIVATNNFHGRTTSIISFSSNPEYKKHFGPLTPGFKEIPFGDSKALENAINKKTIGFLLEPIQGEAGVYVPPQGYLTEIRQICTNHNILLMLDEIQTGLGRTGKMFAFQYENAKPDLLMVGKALSGGFMPVSAVLGRKEVMNAFKAGDHGSTYGGNPLGCAVSLAALDVLETEGLLENSIARGEQLRQGLKALNSKSLTEIRGKGLMTAIDIDPTVATGVEICKMLIKKGVLSKDTHKQSIRLTPPLLITEQEIDWLLNQLKDVF